MGYLVVYQLVKNLASDFVSLDKRTVYVSELSQTYVAQSDP
jgi:hypothetical protein